MISKNNSPRLQKLYTDKASANLQKDLELNNPMEVPRLAKIVINIGVGSAVTDSRAIQRVLDVVEKIAGQKPVKTVAKKSIAGFKLREDMPIGVRVTLLNVQCGNF